MTDNKVENIDTEDAEDLLIKIEKSFDIKFGDTELMHIKTFGEFCDHLVNKIQLDNTNDCTTQQAFYKLRNAISSTFNVESKAITTDFLLNTILPRKSRREKIINLENSLGFQLNILRPPHWVINTLLVLFFSSIVGLFLKWQYGLVGVFISYFWLWFSKKISNELDVQTVGQLAKKITRENYLESRRNPKTFNKNEIEKVLTDWFINDLCLDKKKLSRDSKFE